MPTEINIKSTTIEKSLDLIKSFTEKLLGQTAEEVGLLMADKVKYFRFKNQVKILTKAKEYVKSKNINIQRIPIKILVPLLENASLEDDEKMQDKWAYMIANLADSKQNFQNHVFPYLLSQISLNEFESLSKFVMYEYFYMIDNQKFIKFNSKKNIKYKESIKKIFDRKKRAEQDGFWFDEMSDSEYSNLIRLGLLKQLPPKIIVDQDIDFVNSNETNKKSQSIDAEYDPENFGYRTTSLGIDFVLICDNK